MKKLLALSLFIFASPSWAQFDYRCSGTEPFWSLEIKGNHLNYHDMEDVFHDTKVVGPKAAAGTAPGFATVYHSENRNDVVSITAIQCNDGMSDVEYSHTVMVLSGERVLFGCCETLSKK